jgi:hypothetical protein
MDRRQLLGDFILQFSAMVFAFLIVSIMILGAIYAAVSGYENLAITIASGSGLALVAGVVSKIYLNKKAENPPTKPSNKPPKKKRT